VNAFQMFQSFTKCAGWLKRVRWLGPSESKCGPDCAVLAFDLDVPPGAVAGVGFMTAWLRSFGAEVDTDHAIFQYLGSQQEAYQSSEITVTVSIKRREAADNAGRRPRRVRKRRWRHREAKGPEVSPKHQPGPV